MVIAFVGEVLERLRNGYLNVIDDVVRGWIEGHPIEAFPPEGAEVHALAVFVALLGGGVLLSLTMAVLRGQYPRWDIWRRSRTRTIRALGVIVPVALCLVVLELSLRGFVATHPADSPWLPHPLYFWAFPPHRTDLHVVYPQVPIHTNRSGFRGDDIPYEKEAGEFRILVTGDSNGFGHGVDQRDTWPMVLERKLAARFRDRKITVVNAATPGYSISQSYYRFEEEGIRYHPDLLIVGSHKWAVSEDHLANRERIASSPALRWMQTWACRSYLYLLLRKQVARAQNRRADLIVEDFASPMHPDTQYLDYCQRFLQLSRSTGMATLVVAPLPPYPDFQDAWNRMPPLPSFKNSLLPGDRVALMEWRQDLPEAEFVLSAEDHHFSARGHASIAAQFYEAIVQNHLVK